MVAWHDKTRGAVEGSERGMSATGSELMNAIQGLAETRVPVRSTMFCG